MSTRKLLQAPGGSTTSAGTGNDKGQGGMKRPRRRGSIAVRRLAARGAAGTLAGVFAMAATGDLAVADPGGQAGRAAGHTVAQSSIGYPFHVDRWDSIPITIDFGRSFGSVSKVCLTARFGKDDLLDPNEEIFVDYPEQAGETDPGGAALPRVVELPGRPR